MSNQEKKRKRGVYITVAIVGVIAAGLYLLMFIMTAMRG